MEQVYSYSEGQDAATLSALYLICCVPFLNGGVADKLISFYGSPTEVLYASEASLRHNLPPAMAETLIGLRCGNAYLRDYEAFLSKGGLFIPRGDTRFPACLSTIPDAPLGLFLLGTLPDWSRLHVGVIGARECSEYGHSIANTLGEYLGKHNITLVSGMARGIDGISQEAALDAGGFSIAVPGCGPDVCYPTSNHRLYHKLLEQGCILSIYGPGQPAIANHFPPRNRIVSGLSRAIVVVEARQRSGTLITVDMALEQGRDVYAVPGRLTDRLSDGCNGLIGQGANVYLSPALLVNELLGDGPNAQKHKSFNGTSPCKALPKGDAGLVYQKLDYQPMTMEGLAGKLPADYTIPQISMLLMGLVLDGYVNQISPGQFSKIL